MSTVYVCPSRDRECGEIIGNWCNNCPKLKAAPAKRIAELEARLSGLRAAADGMLDALDDLHKRHIQLLRKIQHDASGLGFVDDARNAYIEAQAVQS